MQRQGGPPGTGTPRQNEPTERTVAQRRRGVVPPHPAVLLLTNVGDMPVHLAKGHVIGSATAYNGPLHVVEEEEKPEAVLTGGADPRDKPDGEVKTGQQAEDGIDEGQPTPHPPDKTCPKPEGH